MLRGEGAWTDGRAMAVRFNGDVYEDRTGVAPPMTREAIMAAASNGELVLTLTGRMGHAHEPSNPQPLLWGDPARNGSWTLVEHFGPSSRGIVCCATSSRAKRTCGFSGQRLVDHR